MAGFTEPAESLKKSELIDALIGAREDGVSIPPSSPGRADASSDGQSSDDGHFAGDEETDAPARHPSNGRQLLRRATMYDMTPRPKHMNHRSVSLGNLLGNGQSSKLFLEEGVGQVELTTKYVLLLFLTSFLIISIDAGLLRDLPLQQMGRQYSLSLPQSLAYVRGQPLDLFLTQACPIHLPARARGKGNRNRLSSVPPLKYICGPHPNKTRRAKKENHLLTLIVI
ncbi:hypothetical protein CPB83DRAFT_662504 [Crepidotus variabilis]|uniref:Uncharacterized protein n=1 Tax=Crepidotus variabilis TaxID=179855 RepID=A0A9P6JU54_9AGAR|nr:hypothetical protein CPB83DRAFT_662504 [Crepidotus variabilis]